MPIRGPSLLRALALDLMVVQAVAFGVLLFVLLERLNATVEELETRDMQEATMDLVGHLSLAAGPKLTLSPGDMARPAAIARSARLLAA